MRGNQQKTAGDAFGQANNKGNGRHRSGPQDAAPLPKREELIGAITNKLAALQDGHGSLNISGEVLAPTANQKKLMSLINSKDIVFVNGPVGTGKTFWTCVAALKGLAEGKYHHIALTAPAVESDEKLGFLPGSKDEKLEEHVNQILESFDDLVGRDFRVQMQQAGLIEIAPHAFNRGRTYKHTLYILDECQNASAKNLMTSIGRLGFKSTFVYMGDDRRNDRTIGRSAYVSFAARFTSAAYANEIGSVTMGKEDVRRHPLLAKIVANDDDRPLEGFENGNDSTIRKSTIRTPSDRGHSLS
jgi:phosphate starvation-inducible PhoH-like protein